jgi:1,5-anhydro-D-fructose reductase (1,5-anhydro-D-mannitol-forming)
VTRVSIVGTGFWGAKLAEAVGRSSLELAACYSRNADRRAEFAERFGCHAAGSFEAALDACDAVVLATPNTDHEAQTLEAARRVRHVFVEKPIATTIAAGERMRDACAAAGVTLSVGHELRRLGAARKAKELVESGALGTVVLAEANFSLTSPVKPGTWKEGRGTPLVQLGVHHADTLQYLLGPVARTTGRVNRLVSEVDIDDTGAAILELESGALATITSSYVSPKTYSIRLLGTDAVLDYRTDISVWPAADRLDSMTTLTVAGERIPFPARDPLVEELEELGRCARGEAAPETGATEGIAALRVILDALASSRPGAS